MPSRYVRHAAVRDSARRLLLMFVDGDMPATMTLLRQQRELFIVCF